MNPLLVVWYRRWLGGPSHLLYPGRTHSVQCPKVSSLGKTCLLCRMRIATPLHSHSYLPIDNTIFGYNFVTVHRNWLKFFFQPKSFFDPKKYFFSLWAKKSFFRNHPVGTTEGLTNYPFIRFGYRFQ